MSRRSPARLAAACSLALCAAIPAARAADAPEAAPDPRQQMAALPWQNGPSDGAVGTRSHLAYPQGTSLLPEASGAKFLELTGNIPSDGNTVLRGSHWFAVLDFTESGYVKDDDKLDADELLKTLKSGQESSNAERRKRHLDEMFVDGWIVPPHYDSQSRQLEYGLKLHDSSGPAPIVNYTMRILGRHGYETAVVVTSPETLQADVAEVRGILKGFDFNSGERYSEFVPGDHVAEFGLGALVVGGAAAAVIKGGWWKGILAALVAGWKLVAAGAVALFAGIGKFFGKGSDRGASR
jgi:uncharacterized membrane-anchored protein